MKMNSNLSKYCYWSVIPEPIQPSRSGHTYCQYYFVVNTFIMFRNGSVMQNFDTLESPKSNIFLVIQDNNKNQLKISMNDFVWLVKQMQFNVLYFTHFLFASADC